MTPRTANSPRAIDRASIGSSYLRRDFLAWSRPAGEEDPVQQRLCLAWFQYQVRRTTDMFVLSGARDVGALAGCLNNIVQSAFHILLARNRAEVASARDIRSTGRIRYTRLWDGNGRGARLGTARRCVLGRSMILGDSAAEQAARFDLTVELSVFQIYRLRGRPDVLDWILDAFEAAVPLNLDYRLILSARRNDRTFRLAAPGNGKPHQDKKPADSDAGAGRFPLLGITTELGAG